MTDRHTMHLHSDYLDKSLSAEQRRAVERHLATCSECRRDFDLLRNLLARLSEIESPDPGIDYFNDQTEKIMARTASPSERRADTITLTPPAPSSQRILKILIRLAAVITLLFGSFYVSGLIPERYNSRLGGKFAQSEYQIPAPISLPDAEHQQGATPTSDTPPLDEEVAPTD